MAVQIQKPTDKAVSQFAWVIQKETTDTINVDAQFTELSVLGKGSSGTFTVQVGDNAAQTLNFNTVYTLGYKNKPYAQSVQIVPGAGITAEVSVIY